MKGKVAMLEEMDCFGADASRNDGKSRNDGLRKSWIVSSLTLLAMTGKVAMTGEANSSRNEGLMKKH